MFTKGIAKISGQRRGTPNRLTTNFREAVLLAYENISGHEAFSKWAAENRTDFYKIAARLIPTEVKGSDDEGLTIIVYGREKTALDAQPALEHMPVR